MPFSSQIPQSTEGKDWFLYVDKTVSMELLEQLTDEFIQIYDRSPTRLKSKLGSTIKDLSASVRTVRSPGESMMRNCDRIDFIAKAICYYTI